MLRDRDSSTERRSAIQLQVRTILNHVQRFVGFVYQEVQMLASPEHPESREIEIRVVSHRQIRGRS